MTDREKLVELIRGTPDVKVWPDAGGKIADHLIANGVTVQKWIPVTEQLPERDSVVLVFYEAMRGTSAAIQVTKGWNVYGSAIHWMPLPCPPKEDEA